jgi:hypothetical protein
LQGRLSSKEIDNKNPPFAKKIHNSAIVPALLPPISTQVEKEAMPLAEKKMPNDKRNGY